MTTDIYKWLFGPKGRKALQEAPDLLWDLPDELHPYRAEIAATVRPYIAMASVDAPPEPPTGSQLGGLAWWPADEPYPTAADGRTPLHLLAQINFNDVPRIGLFPAKGLLQIFIAADAHYGCDFTHAGIAPGFRCVFHRDLTRPALEPQDYLTLGPELSPLTTPLQARALLFDQATMAIDPTDYRFPEALWEICQDPELYEAYIEWHVVPALRLGGYPTFTQEDPRAERHGGLGDVTLLMLESTDGIIWGDAGGAQFLMSAEDLKKRDFSRVVYNWDCN
jgi:uncharacterized protein YwqG